MNMRHGLTGRPEVSRDKMAGNGQGGTGWVVSLWCGVGLC